MCIAHGLFLGEIELPHMYIGDILQQPSPISVSSSFRPGYYLCMVISLQNNTEKTCFRLHTDNEMRECPGTRLMLQ